MSLAVVVSLSACTGGTSVPTDSSLNSSQIQRLADEARDEGYEGQAARLEDGEATASEYQDSISDYIQCVSVFGYAVSEPMLSPIDGLTFEYVTDTSKFSEGEPEANVRSCQEKTLSYVQPAYLGSHEAEMDPPLRDAMTACLAKSGIQANGNETKAADFVAADGFEYGPFSQCISETTYELYPDLPSVSVSF